MKTIKIAQLKAKAEPTRDSNPTFRADFLESSVVGQQRAKLEAFIKELDDVFSKHRSDVSSATVESTHYMTLAECPVSAKLTRTSFQHRNEVESHMKAVVNAGVLVDNNTPWVYGLVCVGNKDKIVCPCMIRGHGMTS